MRIAGQRRGTITLGKRIATAPDESDMAFSIACNPKKALDGASD